MAGGNPPAAAPSDGTGPERVPGGGGFLAVGAAPLLCPVVGPEGVRQPEGGFHHWGPAHLCGPGQR